MGTPNPEYLRKVYFNHELDIAVFLFKFGLETLQQDKLYRRKTFGFFTLLVMGLERFMKLILYLHTLETENKHMSQKDFKQLGHNLVELRDRVIEKCFTPEYLLDLQANNDLDYLKNDQALQEMLDILSNFATEGRYIYLDAVSQPTSNFEWPEALWEQVGTNMIQPDWGNLLKGNNLEKMVKEINRNFVIRLEKFFRALARLFAGGVLGQTGKVYTSKLREFWAIQDDELGTTKYDAVT